MTAPPDLLEAVLAAFPGELRLLGRDGGLLLEITAPDLRGTVFAGHRPVIAGFAVAYQRMRDDMRNATPRCECGDLRTSHDMTRKGHPCGRYQCECAGWQQAEGDG